MKSTICDREKVDTIKKRDRKKYERKLNNNGQCQEKLGQKEKKKSS